MKAETSTAKQMGNRRTKLPKGYEERIQKLLKEPPLSKISEKDYSAQLDMRKAQTKNRSGQRVPKKRIPMPIPPPYPPWKLLGYLEPPYSSGTSGF
jgi:hypothetical protein